jgi:type IV pilus assembly protein PilM
MAAVWGIDIGKAALKAVKLDRTKEGIEIKALEHIPYEVKEDEDERSEHVNAALKSFLLKHKVSERVIVGLPGLHAFSRFIKMPPVDKNKLGQMVRLEAQQQIPFPIAEVNWDWVKIEREYEPGEEVEVGIFATRSELVDGFLRDLRDVKLAPDIVTISPLAVYNFIRYNAPAQEGATVVLDIGSEHTDLVIIDGERFWVRNLRIAGNDVTKALAEKFKVPFAEAEKLKKSASKSDQAKKIFTVMEGVLKDMVTEVNRSVGFFKQQAPELDVKRMVLVGDGAKVKNMTKYLTEALGYEVERVQELAEDKFNIDPDVDLDLLKNHLLGFAVSLGLALQGVDSAKCSINLAPQDLQLNAQLKKKVPFAAAAAACAWAALGLSMVQWKANTAALKGTVAEAQTIQQYEEIQTKAAEHKDTSQLEAHANSLVGLGKGRTLVLDLVEAINGVLATTSAKNNPEIPLPAIYQENEELKKQDLRVQQEAYMQRIQKEKLYEKKLWVVGLKIFEATPAANPSEPLKPGEKPQAFYKVQLDLAKAIPSNMLNAADLSSLRDEIKREVVGALVSKLEGEPFFVRDGEQSPPAYGQVSVGTLTRVTQLHPNAISDPPGGKAAMFPCIIVPVKFEVGAPKPKPVEAPKPAEGEGGEAGGEGGGEEGKGG